MKREHDHNDNPHSQQVSRRAFIKLAAAAGLLAGCSSARRMVSTPTGLEATSTPLPPTLTPTATPTPAPTSTPTVTPTSAPTATSTPLPTPTRPPSWPEVIEFYPDVPSKVVHAHHAGVWTGDTLSPVVLRQMLDASIIELTGLNDAHEAWAALFDPHERIAIKVNTIEESRYYWTHVPLVMAVAEKLQEIGVPVEQIFIFDRATFEMEGAGYPINEDGPGVRCYGSGKKGYTENWTLKGHMEDRLRDSPIGLSNILLDCDALINIPLLKSHHISGISFAMKNHFGTFDRPGDFHQGIGVAIPELNALSPIRERSRLIIGDALEIVNNTRWTTAATGDSILMSFDPVAHDVVGLNLHNKVSTGASRATRLSKSWLKYGAELGLGTNDLDNVELAEVNLG